MFILFIASSGLETAPGAKKGRSGEIAALYGPIFFLLDRRGD
jgi:hypothetical protein